MKIVLGSSYIISGLLVLVKYIQDHCSWSRKRDLPTFTATNVALATIASLHLSYSSFDLESSLHGDICQFQIHSFFFPVPVSSSGFEREYA